MNADSKAKAVLSGVRIVEIAGIGPGPFCGMLLADMGADVITVERPSTGIGRPRPAQIVDRGKRSIVLDLKAPGAAEALLKLIDNADALIEGMRPGVMERLGLGPAVCLTRNPALVYGRMTGWGQDGPMALVAGHDSNYTALSGALWFASPAGQAPQAPATLLGDIAGGALYLALGIVAGVLRARHDGLGQVVDAAIVDGSAHMLNLLLGVFGSKDADFSRGNNAFDAAHWAGRSYRCSDGGWVNLASLEPQFYAELLRRLDLDGDARFANGQMDVQAWPELTQILRDLFMTRTRSQWCEILERSDACFAPVLNPAEAAAHPHMAARGTYFVNERVLQAAPAPRFSITSSPRPEGVPVIGAHTREVLSELGLSEAEVQRLVESGAINFSRHS